MPRAPSRTIASRVVAAVFVGALLTLATVSAQTGGGYDLSWWSSEGGGVSQSSGYTLAGSIGQPDASAPMTGGGYALTGGFWTGAGTGSIDAPENLIIYLPAACRDNGCRGPADDLEGAER